MAHIAHASITLRDSRGRTTTRRYGLKEATAADDAEADALALAALLVAVTKLGLCNVHLIWDCDATATAPTSPSNIDEGATISGWITEFQKKAALKLPSLKDALFNSDGTLKLTDVDVAALIDDFCVGGNSTLSDGEQWAVAGEIKGTLDKK